MSILLKSSAIGILLGAATMSVPAAEVTLAPVSDTSIHENGNNPKGTSTILSGARASRIGAPVDRGFLRFDLSTIPAGATINSVRLRLRVVQIPGDPATSNFGLHRMLTQWTDAATWADARPGVAWASPGGGEGVDFAAASSASKSVAGLGLYEFGPSEGLVNDVKAWVADGAANQGWLLKSAAETTASTARHFAASASGASAPQLLIEYTVATAAGPELKDPQVVGGNFSFSFNGSAGQSYRVESVTDVGAGAWTTFTNTPAATSSDPIVITAPIEGTHRFFRVVVP